MWPFAIFISSYFKCYKFQCTILCTTYILYIEEFPAVLLRSGNENRKQLFCTMWCYLKMAPVRPETCRGVVVYSIIVVSIKVCAFVCLDCRN